MLAAKFMFIAFMASQVETFTHDHATNLISMVYGFSIKKAQADIVDDTPKRQPMFVTIFSSMKSERCPTRAPDTCLSTVRNGDGKRLFSVAHTGMKNLY